MRLYYLIVFSFASHRNLQQKELQAMLLDVAYAAYAQVLYALKRIVIQVRLRKEVKESG
ncbi:MAG: hypothetical protein ACFFF4_02355 [Candidatus Thorarchaeota archaeon]